MYILLIVVATLCRIILTVMFSMRIIVTVIPIPAWSMIGKSFQKEAAIVKPLLKVFDKNGKYTPCPNTLRGLLPEYGRLPL